MPPEHTQKVLGITKQLKSSSRRRWRRKQQEGGNIVQTTRGEGIVPFHVHQRIWLEQLTTWRRHMSVQLEALKFLGNSLPHSASEGRTGICRRIGEEEEEQKWLLLFVPIGI
jgi:hypothetical protein